MNSCLLFITPAHGGGGGGDMTEQNRTAFHHRDTTATSAVCNGDDNTSGSNHPWLIPELSPPAPKQTNHYLHAVVYHSNHYTTLSHLTEVKWWQGLSSSNSTLTTTLSLINYIKQKYDRSNATVQVPFCNAVGTARWHVLAKWTHAELGHYVIFLCTDYTGWQPGAAFSLGKPRWSSRVTSEVGHKFLCRLSSSYSMDEPVGGVWGADCKVQAASTLQI